MVCRVDMAVFVVVIMLLYVLQISNESRSRHHRSNRGLRIGSWKTKRGSQPAVIILDLNKHRNPEPDYFNLKDLIDFESMPTDYSQDRHQANIYKYDTSDKTYCDVMADSNNIHIAQLISLFQGPPSNVLRVSDAVLICERNCSQIASKLCPSCIEATLNILAYSCKRKCQLTKGESEYLHDRDVHPGPEYMCKKKREEHSRCCKDNCLRSIFKQCYFKKVRICTQETVSVLKSSCISKCERGSDNPYLNAFCSFVFKYKKQRPLYKMNMSSTYFWENHITPYPI